MLVNNKRKNKRKHENDLSLTKRLANNGLELKYRNKVTFGEG